jgi:hypothetical protein
MALADPFRALGGATDATLGSRHPAPLKMAEQPTERSWERTLYRWLSAPLLITIIGALLINYVIPKITSRSQNHQRALEIKTQLVREMSESASSAVVTGQLVATDVISKKKGGDTNAVFQSGLRDWQIASARIRSEIEGYFPRTTLGDQWGQFSEALTNAYFLSASGTSFADRCARVRNLQRYFGDNQSCDPQVQTGLIRWGTLIGARLPGGRTSGFRTTYISLASRLTTSADEQVKRLLHETPAGF